VLPAQCWVGRLWVGRERPARWGDSSSEPSRGWPATHKGNSVFGDQPFARRPSCGTRCRQTRTPCRPRLAARMHQWSDREGGHMAGRPCEPAGHGGPSASFAPCVRVRAQREARHRPVVPGEGPTQRTFTCVQKGSPGGRGVKMAETESFNQRNAPRLTGGTPATRRRKVGGRSGSPHRGRRATRG
jgi:hypothetical protein